MKIQEALAYQNLYARLKNEQFNIKLAYKLNKLNSKITAEAIFYEETLQKILSQYAQKNEDGSYAVNESGNGILVKPECLEICHKEIAELESIEFEVPNITFTLDELADLKITPVELACLESLIIE